MDAITLLINGGFIVIQSIVCIVFSCNINHRIEKMKARIRHLYLVVNRQNLHSYAYTPPNPPNPTAPFDIEDPEI